MQTDETTSYKSQEGDPNCGHIFIVEYEKDTNRFACSICGKTYQRKPAETAPEGEYVDDFGWYEAEIR